MRILALLLLLIPLGGAHRGQPQPALAPEIRAILDHISADSLKGHLSFIASDLLEGRDTPSRGLDIAAEYIAAQFRRAGLEPGGSDGYLQRVKLLEVEPAGSGSTLRLAGAGKDISIAPANARLLLDGPVEIPDIPVFKITPGKEWKAEELRDKAVIFDPREFPKGWRLLSEAHPKLVLMINHGNPSAPPGAHIMDPEAPRPRRRQAVLIWDKEAATWFEALPAGLTDAKVSLKVEAPTQKAASASNVIGILRGSDPALKNSCVVVSAHYDHLGMKPEGEGDRIYNGANDDGSGTVSVIEIASALARAKEHPKRSIVFVAFFGEEKGGFGASYFVRHPPCPLAGIAADLNLEQLGRTDSTEGPHVGEITWTGHDYTTISEVLKTAAKATGLGTYNQERSSDVYFSASDNYTLAEAGVPAITLCVAYQYPDYHGVGDEWPKIDFANLAKVDRTIAVAVWKHANSSEAPRWVENNPKVKPFLEAWRRTHAQ